MKKCRKTAKFISVVLRGALFLVLSVCAISGFPLRAGGGPQGPTASITGRVTVPTGEGAANNLAGITVKLTGPSPATTAISVVTDAEGRYEFARVATGSYTIGVNADGFKPFTATVTPRTGQATSQDIVLQISSVNEQIQVQGEATDVATQSVSATSTVSEQQLEALPLPTAKFTEALALTPTVIRTPEGKLNFKGQPESQGMLLVDSTENVDPVSGSFAIPIPVEAIQSLTVYNTADSSEFGGFSGGLTRIELKPPAAAWNYKVLDFIPSFRGKDGHLVGIANFTPRFAFGGPIIKDKLNFSEDLSYEFRKLPVRGLSWPVNETTTHSFVSMTQLQAILSPRHLLNFDVNIFPSDIKYANINSLVPQTASANYNRDGVSVGITDSYQFASGAFLNSFVRYTRFDSNSIGQGPADMQITPEGWGGNFFNSWSRRANQLEALPTYQLPAKTWHGRHELKFGTDVFYRSYSGSSVSHPIELFRQDGSLAERIDFQGTGLLDAKSEEVSEFAEDHWTLNTRISFNFGARVTSQSLGRGAAFAPRVGAALASASGKSVLRGSAGVIYGHVPLLAVNFANNQQRVISFFDTTGTLVGQPITLQNIYLPQGSGTSPPVTQDPNSSDRTFTWNVEYESEVRKNLSIRVGYLDTYSVNLFVVDQVLGSAGSASMLALSNTGVARYNQAAATAHYQPAERADLNISYVWSRARGDLNAISNTFVLFQVPVVHPQAYGVLPSDIPNRVVAWGTIHLPWKLVVSPVGDLHSGFPYSNVDVLQNYVGVPNSQRLPIYFSLDARIYREMSLRLPFFERSKTHKFRLGFYSLNVTNHSNPHDVFNNVTSPIFGEFAGFQRRINGLVLDFVE